MADEQNPWLTNSYKDTEELAQRGAWPVERLVIECRGNLCVQ
jgi:hypothetical protein